MHQGKLVAFLFLLRHKKILDVLSLEQFSISNGNSLYNIEDNMSKGSGEGNKRTAHKSSEMLEQFNDFLYWREPFESLNFDEIFPPSFKNNEVPNKALNENEMLNEKAHMNNYPQEQGNVHQNRAKSSTVTTEISPVLVQENTKNSTKKVKPKAHKKQKLSKPVNDHPTSKLILEETQNNKNDAIGSGKCTK